MNTILVPLDGSTVAEQVLPTVRQLASVLNARVRLLRVVTEREAEQEYTQRFDAQTTDTPTTSLDRILISRRLVGEQAAAYLAGHLGTFCQDSIPVDYEVRIGDPAAMIVAVAARIQATLIAMGTHGYGGLRRWALGSVSDKVMRSAMSPVVLVRSVAHPSPSEHPLRRVLVSVDGSEASFQALALGHDLARRADAQLVLVTAIHGAYPAVAWLGLRQDASLADRQAAATAKLDAIADTLRHELLSIRTIVAAGDTAEVIALLAKRRPADLIIMAAHSDDKPHRWGVKSVVNDVLHATTAPLLLVPAAPESSADSSVIVRQSSAILPADTKATPF